MVPEKEGKMTSTTLSLLTTFLIVLYIPGGFGIKGGGITSIESFPHQVAIVHSGIVLCGGGIISDRHILTAAHCAILKTNTYRTDIEVISGIDDLTDDRWMRKHEIIMVLCHGRYKTTKWGESDIAILKLKAPIFFSPRRRPVPVSFNPVPVYSNVTLVGWGDSGFEFRDQYLRSISMVVIPPHLCELLKFMDVVIDQYVFCAVVDNIYEGISYGDSGGLVIYNGEAVGVAFGGMRLSIGNPAVATQISSFRPWIEASMERF